MLKILNLFKKKDIGQLVCEKIKEEESKNPNYWEEIPYYMDAKDYEHCPDLLEWILYARWVHHYNFGTYEQLHDWDLRFKEWEQVNDAAR